MIKAYGLALSLATLLSSLSFILYKSFKIGVK